MNRYLPYHLCLLALVALATGCETEVDRVNPADPKNPAYVPPPGTLEGVIVDEEGAGIPGAELCRSDGRAPPICAPTSADEPGAFDQALPPGSYTLTARADGYLPQGRLVLIESGGEQSMRIALVADRATIRGTVQLGGDRLPDEAPLFLQQVQGADAGGREPLSEWPNSSWDQETGDYTVVVPSGAYELTAQAEGYLEQSVAIALDVASGRTQQVANFELVADSGELSGRVQMADGAPLPGDAPLLVRGAGGGLQQFSALEGHSWDHGTGQFSVRLRSGFYVVTTALDGYLPQSATIVLDAASGRDEEEVEFVLAPDAGHIWGTVGLEGGGRLPAEPPLEIEGSAGERRPLAEWPDHEWDAGTGGFRVAVPSGTYVISAQLDAHIGSSASATINATSDVTEQRVDLTLVPDAGVISGQIRLGDGARLPDDPPLEIELASGENPGGRLPLSQWPGHRWEVGTGRFSVPVPSGTYVITARLDAYIGHSATATINAASRVTEQRIDFALAPDSGIISGHVQLGDERPLPAEPPLFIERASGDNAGGREPVVQWPGQEWDAGTGQFSIPVPSGTYVITAEFDAHIAASATATINAASGQTAQRLELDLIADRGTIRGRVDLPPATLAGQPPPLAVQRIDGPEQGGRQPLLEWPASVWDPVTGAYEVTLDSGTYVVAFERPGYLPDTRTVTLNAAIGLIEQRADFAPIADAGVISGRVQLGDDGALPPDAPLTVQQIEGEAQGGVRGWSALDDHAWDPETGEFSAPLPSGTYVITARQGGYLTQSATATINAATGQTAWDVEFDLVADAGHISGHVRLGDGAPPPPSPPLLIQRVSGAEPGGREAVEAWTGHTWDTETAAFSIPVPSGTYVLTGRADGYLDRSATVTINAASGQVDRVVELDLIADSGLIHGTALRQQLAGEPTAEGVELTLQGLEGAARGGRIPLVEWPDSAWDPASGAFSVRVPSGSYTLTATAPGSLTQSHSVTIDAARGQVDRALNIELVSDSGQIAGRALRGRVDAPPTAEGVGLTLRRVDGGEGAEQPAGPAFDAWPGHAWDRETGAFEVTLPSGTYALTAEADGYISRSAVVVISAESALNLGDIVLEDPQPPAQPTIAIERRLVNRLTVDVDVAHPEVGVELGVAIHAADARSGAERVAERGGDAADGFERARFGVTLLEGDGAKQIIAIATDGAGNRAEVAETITLDTTPPIAGALVLADGAAEVRSLTINAAVREGVDAVRFGYTVVPADGECGAVQPDHALTEVLEIQLLPDEGPQRVCWAVADEAGNVAQGEPADVRLGPYDPRPVPDLVSVNPAELIARPSGVSQITITGRRLAPDTTVEIGAQVSVACLAVAAPGEACGDAADRECARCEIELPDEVRLTPGLYPVTLRTPHPVQNGLGVSGVVWLQVLAPPPLIDRVEPQGMIVRPGEPATVEITIEGQDILPTAAVRLANRLPTTIERIADPRSDQARLVATFDLTGIEPSNDAPQSLTIENPEALPVNIPFGVVGPVRCVQNQPCRVRPRRTYPSSLPGHVSIEMSLPGDVLDDSFTIDGVGAWTLLGLDGRPVSGRRTPYGPGRVHLPGPITGGRLVVDVPIASTRPVEVIPARTSNEPEGCTLELAQAVEPGATVQVLADVDGDGQLDGVFSDDVRGLVYTTIAPDRPLNVGGRPGAVGAGDINGDGWIDLIVGDDRSGVVTAYLGAGDGRFPHPVPLPPTPMETISGRFYELIVTDVEGDRRPDILANMYGPDGGVVRWTILPDGRIGPAEVIVSNLITAFVTPSEIHRPGVPEVIAWASSDRQNSVRSWPFSDDDVVAPWMRRSLRNIGTIGPDPAGEIQLMLLTQSYGLRRGAQRPGDDWERIETDIDFRAESTAVDLDGDGTAEAVAFDRNTLVRIDMDQPTYTELGDVGREPIVYTLASKLTPHLQVVVGERNELWVADGCLDGSGAPATPEQRAASDQPPLVDGQHAWFDIDGDEIDELLVVNNHTITADVSDGGQVQRLPLDDGDWRLLAVEEVRDEVPRLILARLSEVGAADHIQVHAKSLDGRVDEQIAAARIPSRVLDLELLDSAAPASLAVRTEETTYITRGDEVTALPAHPVGGLRAARHLETGNLRVGAPLEGAPPDVLTRTADGLVAWGFRDGRWVELGTWTWDALAITRLLDWTTADMDGDGVSELIVTNHAGISNGVRIYVFGHDGPDGLFERRLHLSNYMYPVHTLGPTMHIADADADGALDVVLGGPGAGLRLKIDNGGAQADDIWANIGILFGRGDGTLTENPLPLADCDPELPVGGQGERMTIGTPDVNGDGYPEVVSTIGSSRCIQTIHPTREPTLSSRFKTDPRASADGSVHEALHHAGGDFHSATLIVTFDRDAEGVTGRLTNPRGQAVDLAPMDTHDGVLSWTSLEDDSPLTTLLGHGAAGDWVVGLEPPPEARIRSIELLLGVRWRRSLDEVDRGEGEGGCLGLLDWGSRPREACSVGVGACAADGEWICHQGGGLICDAAPSAPAAEICNGLDDDCDGSIDESEVNIVSNSGFEAPDVARDTPFGAGCDPSGNEQPCRRVSVVPGVPDIPGWELDPDANAELLGPSARVYRVHSGEQSVWLRERGSGLSQSLDTEPGARYMLSFSASTYSEFQPRRDNLRVEWGGARLGSFDSGPRGHWLTYNVPVRANAETTSLRFIGDDDLWNSPTIDSVSVVALDHCDPGN